MGDQAEETATIPAQRYPLTTDEREKLLNFVREKWKRGCPLCESDAHWNVGGWSAISLGPRPDAVVLGEVVLPAVALVCGNCGNTVFINAIVAGLDTNG